MAIGEGLFRAAKSIFGWITDDREDDPTEESDAAGCDVPATACDFDPTDREAEADESEWVASDEINEAFKPEPIVMVKSPEDGMPVPAEERSDLAFAAPFTIDTVICVEDERSYVELYDEELKAAGWHLARDDDRRGPGIGWQYGDCGSQVLGLDVRYRYDDEGLDLADEPRTFEPACVVSRYGQLFAPSPNVSGALVPVRPKRERCKHYRRMSMACSDIPDQTEFGHFMLFRNCAQRRSVGGALMTLRDEAVYACDYRDPPEPASVEKYLDEPDRKRLASAADVELIRPFNMADS